MRGGMPRTGALGAGLTRADATQSHTHVFIRAVDR